MEEDRPLTGSPEHLHVLLASDDSETARLAEHWLAAAHWSRPAVIDIVTVAHRPVTRLGWTLEGSRESVEKAIAQLREGELLAAQTIANDVGQRLQDAGLMVRTWARQGEVIEELTAMVDEIQPALVVIGPRGRSGLVEAILGSVTLQLIERCDRPVLVARTVAPPDGGPIPQHVAVLVASEAGGRVAIAALDQIGWLTAERLTIVGLLGETAGLAPDDPILSQEVGGPLRDEVVATIERLVAALPSGATEPELEVRAGHPTQAAIHAVRDLGPDLAVVVRPHRDRGSDPFAMKVTRHTQASVLVVPGPRG